MVWRVAQRRVVRQIRNTSTHRMMVSNASSISASSSHAGGLLNDASKQISAAISARAPRPIRHLTTSSYPITAFYPSPYVQRFPLLTYDSEEGKTFAEASKDGRLLDEAKERFHQSKPVAAINFHASMTSPYQGHELLKSHILRVPKFRSLLFDERDAQRKTLLLNVKSVEDLPTETQEFLAEEQKKGKLIVMKRSVEIGYEYWKTEDVLAALLPEGLPEGTPTAFTATGHIAHVNLREEHLPYRFVIGQVMLDKNGPVIKTVVNKLDTIDTKFRFFAMERLAGEEEYTVTVSESGCKFTFDFRKVYWNSRLHTEHARLIDLFRPYDVVCDVMAGVGPFAVPAAKKGCHVMANDLNPASYGSLAQNGKKNHVEPRLHAACMDGSRFIKESILRCWNEPFEGAPLSEDLRAIDLDTSSKQRAKEAHRRAVANNSATEIDRGLKRKLIDHFVMNLPATAIEFLGAFRGAYQPIAGQALEDELARRAGTTDESVWPMVHVHCFTKDLEKPYEDICRRANSALHIGLDSPARLVPPSYLGDTIEQKSAALSLDGENRCTPELSIHLVRSVAPNKDMYCLSFRLTKAMLLSKDKL